ncbi:hypothetical protein TCAL_14213 [Tigriopus californicus]|uniref:Kazal-like domain-containing protein n=1 Tax=Tigriopus californicus TaxID=6832 RepID=A0A553NSW0_TIGCA|nr:hypothetical protein TCAL_14213 [Tigriopus californicus]
MELSEAWFTHGIFLVLVLFSSVKLINTVEVGDEKNYKVRKGSNLDFDVSHSKEELQGAESSLKFGYSLPNKSYAVFTMPSAMGGTLPHLPPRTESLPRPQIPTQYQHSEDRPRRKRLHASSFTSEETDHFEEEPEEYSEDLLVFPVEDLEALEEEGEEEPEQNFQDRTRIRYRQPFANHHEENDDEHEYIEHHDDGQPSPIQTDVRPTVRNWLPQRNQYQYLTTTTETPSHLEAYEEHQNTFEEEEENNHKVVERTPFRGHPQRVVLNQYTTPSSNSNVDQHRSPFTSFNPSQSQNHYEDTEETYEYIEEESTPNPLRSRFPRRFNNPTGNDNQIQPDEIQRPGNNHQRPILRNFNSQPEESVPKTLQQNLHRQVFTVRPHRQTVHEQQDFYEQEETHHQEQQQPPPPPQLQSEGLISNHHGSQPFTNFPQRQKLHENLEPDPKPKRHIQSSDYYLGNSFQQSEAQKSHDRPRRIHRQPTTFPESASLAQPQTEEQPPLEHSRPSSPFQYFPQKQLQPPPERLRPTSTPFPYRQQRSQNSVAIDIVDNGYPKGHKRVRKVLRRKRPSNNPLEPEHVTIVPAPPAIIEHYRQRQTVIRGPTPLPHALRDGNSDFHTDLHNDQELTHPRHASMMLNIPSQRPPRTLKQSSHPEFAKSLSTSTDSPPNEEKIFSRSESRTRNELAGRDMSAISRPRIPQITRRPARSNQLHNLKQEGKRLFSTNHQDFYTPNSIVFEPMKPLKTKSGRQFFDETNFDHNNHRVSLTADPFDNPDTLEIGGFMPIHNPYPSDQTGTADRHPRRGRQSFTVRPNQLVKRTGLLLAQAPNETTFINRVANYVVDNNDKNPTHLEDLVTRVVNAEFDRLKPIDQRSSQDNAARSPTSSSTTTERAGLVDLFRGKLHGSLKAATTLKKVGSCQKQMMLLRETFPQCKSFVDVDGCLTPEDTFGLSQYGKCLLEFYPVIRTLPFTRTLSAGSQGQVSFDTDKECTEFVHIFFSDCKRYVESCAAVQGNVDSDLPVLGCLFSQYTAVMMPLLNTGIKVHYR